MNMGKGRENEVSNGNSIGRSAFVIRIHMALPFCILVRGEAHCFRLSVRSQKKGGGNRHYQSYFSAACE